MVYFPVIVMSDSFSDELNSTLIALMTSKVITLYHLLQRKCTVQLNWFVFTWLIGCHLQWLLLLLRKLHCGRLAVRCCIAKYEDAEFPLVLFVLLHSCSCKFACVGNEYDLQINAFDVNTIFSVPWNPQFFLEWNC